MQKIVFVALMVFSLNAMDTLQVENFITSSITPQNAHYLGFTKNDDKSKIVLGEAITLWIVRDSLLSHYPQTPFAVPSSETYLPVILNGTIRCFATINRQGEATSLGHQQLAEELQYIADTYGVELSQIKLYLSTQINSYLFSVPTKERGDEPNLTVLRKGWNRSRSALSSEAVTIEELKAHRGGQQ